MSDFTDLERRGWDRAAGRYDELFGRATRPYARPLVEAAALASGDTVLDVAAGPGYAAAEARRRGALVIAVDQSEPMLAELRERHPGLPTLRATATALPLPDRCADAVLAGFYLNHLDDPLAGARELARVLRPGGRLAATIWAASDRARHNGLIVEAIEAALGPAAARATARPARPLEPAAGALRELAAGAGLERAAVRELAGELIVSDADALLEVMRHSTARTAGLLQTIGDPGLPAVRAALRELARPYERDGALAIPVPALLLSARRP